MPIKAIQNFNGGLNLQQPNEIKDNQFTILKNFFYNKDGTIQTRFGYTTFANTIDSNPITSYFFYQNDSTLAKTAVCLSGTKFYELNTAGTTWVQKKTGLTQYETATGRTTWRTRWDFAVYKNKIYLSNGIDNYAEWDGTTYSEFAAQPKVRYVSYLQDRVFGAGDDSNPNSLYYSNAAPANGQTINTNVVVVGGDEGGIINALQEFGQVILAAKTGKIYSINVAATTALPLDAQLGGFSDRAFAEVGNSLVYLSERGIDTLKQRYGVSGAQALESNTLGSIVYQLTSLITDQQLNANCGLYIKQFDNYYFTFDTNNDNIPDTTLVYSSGNGAWSQYIFPNIYDYGKYIAADGSTQWLFASASGGQMFEFEFGYDDAGTNIDSELQTKEFDFDKPGMYKTFDFVDIVGLIAEGTTILVKVIIDGATVASGEITSANADITTVVKVLGLRPIGLDTLTGPPTPGTERNVYRYVVRIPLYSTGTSISVNMSNSGGTHLLEKMRINSMDETVDVFQSSNIL